MVVCRLFISHVQLLSILWSLNIQFALGLDLAFRWLLCNVDFTLGLQAVSKYMCRHTGPATHMQKGDVLQIKKLPLSLIFTEGKKTPFLKIKNNADLKHWKITLFQ